MIGSSAFAVEAEQVAAQSGQLTRAEVQAELARARAAGELTFASDSYGGFKAVTCAAAPVAAGPRRQPQPRRRARGSPRRRPRTTFNQLYVGG